MRQQKCLYVWIISSRMLALLYCLGCCVSCCTTPIVWTVCLTAGLPSQAMRKMIEGTGSSFAPLATPDLRRLLYRACRHPNRFIRETSYHALAAICSYCKGPQLREFGDQVAECLQDGLSENWSQVAPVPSEQLSKRLATCR